MPGVKIIIIIWILLAPLTSSTNMTSFFAGETTLLKTILEGYDNGARPVYNASKPVIVKIGLVLTQIFNMDERNQVLTMNVWLEQEWHDELLKWEPSLYDNIRYFTIPCNFIWYPDIVLYNNADDFANGFMKSNAIVHYDGRIFWSPPIKLRSSCKIDVTYFPFDDQVCMLKFGSWIYDGFQVDVDTRYDNIELAHYMDNGEWEILNTSVKRNVVFYSCCTEPFPDVTFRIHIRRRTIYYSYNVIVPCVLLSLLTLIQFWLPCESGEKVTLSLTVLLAFSVFMLMIGESMPETSEFMPLIGVYILVVMGISSISVIMAVMILNLHHRGVRKNPVPGWLRFFAFRVLAALLCMRRVRTPNDTLSSYTELHAAIQRAFENFGCRLGEESVSSLIELEHCTRDKTSHLSETEEIVGRIKLLLDKFYDDKKQDEIIQEWQRVAQVIDRCFFWITLAGVFSVTLGLLVLAPFLKPLATGVDTRASKM